MTIDPDRALLDFRALAPRIADENTAYVDFSKSDAIYHGLAGEIVEAVAEHTEADPMGILGTLLATYGAIAGNGRYIYHAGHHTAALFVVLVGETGRGRKGTSWSVVREVVKAAWPGLDDLLVPGLGSGEGLIGHLKRREKDDYRALVIETELARMLSVMAREGNVLSPIIRDAWDGAPMGRVLARESTIVHRHHVGLVAHITPVEMRHRLTATDASNGFGNRFLWLRTARGREVPFPAAIAPLVAPQIKALRAAIEFGRKPGEMHLSPRAREEWAALYHALYISRREGLSGAMTNRTEAYIIRLALTYALLDQAREIGPGHLRAALAVWTRVEQTVISLLGESTGHRNADALLRRLREYPEGLTRQAIRSETGMRSAADIDEAVTVLILAGLVEEITDRDGSRGRPEVVVRTKMQETLPD